MNPHDNTTNRLLRRYLDALAADPHAEPPAGLDESDVALARALTQAHHSLPLDHAQRTRIWTRINTAPQPRTISTLAPPTISPSRNGHADHVDYHMDYKETETMTITTRSWPRQRQDSRSTAQRGLGTLLLVTAAMILIVAGVLVLRGTGDNEPTDPAGLPGDGAFGANQQETPTLDITAMAFVQQTLEPPAQTATRMMADAVQTAYAEAVGTQVALTLEGVVGTYGAVVGGPTATPTPTATPMMAVITATAAFGGDITLMVPLTVVNFSLDQLVWSPDGRMIAGMVGAEVWLFNADNPDNDPIVLTDQTAVTALAFSLDGRYVVAGHEDGSLVWWNTAQWLIVRAEGLNAPITGLAFSPDGRTLLVETGGEVQFWAAP